MNNDIKCLNIEIRTRYSLSKFEDHFELHASVISFNLICVVSGIFMGWFDTKLYCSVGRTNCLYYSTRVDLYIRQIIIMSMTRNILGLSDQALNTLSQVRAYENTRT